MTSVNPEFGTTSGSESCLCRATVEPITIKFGTAEARCLNWALKEQKAKLKHRRYSKLGDKAGAVTIDNMFSFTQLVLQIHQFVARTSCMKRFFFFFQCNTAKVMLKNFVAALTRCEK